MAPLKLVPDGPITTFSGPGSWRHAHVWRLSGAIATIVPCGRPSAAVELHRSHGALWGRIAGRHVLGGRDPRIRGPQCVVPRVHLQSVGRHDGGRLVSPDARSYLSQVARILAFRCFAFCFPCGKSRWPLEDLCKDFRHEFEDLVSLFWSQRFDNVAVRDVVSTQADLVSCVCDIRSDKVSVPHLRDLCHKWPRSYTFGLS